MKFKKSTVTTTRFGALNLKQFLEDVRDNILDEAGEFILNIADDAAKEIQRRLRRQLYSHKPLNVHYRRWKIKKGYDSRILIRTKTYVNNIGIHKVDVKDGVGYWVGPPEGVKEKEGVLLTDLAKWLEYGSKTMPMRPHFRPVFYKVRSEQNILKVALMYRIVKVLEREVKSLKFTKKVTKGVS